ncbi:MAG: FYVE zinc finger domain-containing protein [Candidatus Thorarchaeota archaeon]
MSEENDAYTIFDRPYGLRFIGLLQMAFGLFGLLATAGIVGAILIGGPEILDGMGYIYSILIFAGVALPCLLIGNYMDDLRKQAVIAQIVYSLIAMGLTGFFIAVRGLYYVWTVPLFETEILVQIGNLAAMILLSQSFIILYLIFNWNKVVPPDGVEVIRDRGEAKLAEAGLYPSPLSPSLLDVDGTTELTDEDSQRIMDVRKIRTDEGMAVLCSNCNGATPLTKAKDNKLKCDYCGVTLGISNVFVPCENHPEYLAATTCAVCGDHFCRKCLTAQEPPIDDRWKGSMIFLCKTCFEGRYKPAVTTTSFVIPIDQLFSTAGARFSTVGRIYRRFLGAYGKVLKYLFLLPLEILSSFGKRDDDKKRRGRGGSAGFDCGSGGGGGGDADGCASIIIIVVIIIIAIPIITGVLMLAAAIVIVPLLFYAGLIAVTVEAVKVIRKTDFQSIDSVRIQSLIEKKQPKVKESSLRPATRTWEDDTFRRSVENRRLERMSEEEHRRRRGEKTHSDSLWGGRR